MSSVTRRIARRGHDPMRATLAIHVTIDRMLSDAELAHALRNPPVDVARSRKRSREWARRIEQRLGVPESVRRQFAGQS